ncbi:hypothetical protein ABPG75_007990 [Micractinium tetrahymenae]
MPQLVGQAPTPRAVARGSCAASCVQQLIKRQPDTPERALQVWRLRQQQGSRTRQRRQQQRWPPAAAQQRGPAAAGEEQTADNYSDPLAAQRAALGARVVRHLAGEPSPELRDAVRLLPVHIEPPRAWLTLEAGVAAHGAAALRGALAPRRYPIPSWGSLAHCRCQLAPSPAGRRFRARPINACLSLVFEQLPAAAALAGLPAVQLSRWDLHHGHLFFEPGCGQLGLLLHAKEYPAWEAERFEVHLGHCQQCGGSGGGGSGGGGGGGGGSPLRFDEAAMDTRNYLWVGGRLACLDLSAPTLRPLLMPGLEVPRTVLESDLGQPLADVSYFAELGPGRRSAERLFVTVPGLG